MLTSHRVLFPNASLAGMKLQTKRRLGGCEFNACSYSTIIALTLGVNGAMSQIYQIRES